MSPLKVSPIKAVFVAKEFATHYSVVASEPGAKLTYAWSLKLQRVDVKGGAVDAGCTNRGVLTGTTATFVWHHGGTPADHCDHAKMGPSGHEGLLTVVVSDKTWSCTATFKGTNDGTGTAAVCVKGKPAPAPAGYKCTGPQVKLLDTTNGGGVLNGARQPSFITRGKPYCLVSITTYHWNNGLGKLPGTLGLSGPSGNVGPFKAKSSSGQNGAPNVNWFVNLSTAKPVVINGVYSCVDSDPASWSQNPQTHGTGFCIVVGVSAVKSGTAAPPKTTTTKKKPAPAPAKPKGGKGKLSIKATPDNGNPPLAVTFTLSSPKVVQWRIDFGDGQSKVAIGSPPASLTHTYTRAGDYKPKLTVLASATATSASSATTSITVGTALMSFTAQPSSGAPPLKVTFKLGTSVANITTWSVDFGDGQHTAGAGKPPATVSHTYAKAGTYAANFAVKPGQYAVVAAFAQVTVGGGTPPTLSLTASPTSGVHPLKVTFTLGSNIPGQVVSWQLQFGDGQRAGGSGRPPATVAHTYAKAGTYLAFLVVSQQQAYGGVQFIVPRTGLAVTVR
ncbi:MAG TPA: PKD domain-containing protein [Gaiellaceae bacterium]